MVNKEYEPTDREETVLEILREENRVNPYLIRNRTDMGKGDVNTALSNLTSAGWVRRVTRGLYEYVDDPRTSSQASEPAPMQTETADSEGVIETVLAGWKPGRSYEKQQEQRAAGRATLEYLRQVGEATAGEFRAEVEPEHSVEGQSKTTWWKNSARPALKLARESGVVSFTDGSKVWEWEHKNE